MAECWACNAEAKEPLPKNVKRTARVNPYLPKDYVEQLPKNLLRHTCGK